MTRKKTWIMIAALANILFAPFTLSSSAGSAQPPNQYTTAARTRAQGAGTAVTNAAGSHGVAGCPATARMRMTEIFTLGGRNA